MKLQFNTEHTKMRSFIPICDKLQNRFVYRLAVIYETGLKAEY